ncbi:MAG TPA: DNA mismatch repair protein MutS [Ferruginibacter sp.]|nr:DNA mismatch repair protein MutS [Ferruginibacter sp.]HMP20851.1 DNA mismatch repair protein MutS [Ferruginibacter sp.]
METDKTTLTDLSILDTGDDFSVFNKINYCITSGGRQRLLANFNTPLKTIEAIQGIQQTLQCIIANEQHWPSQISNGGVMVIEKFFTATIDEIPAHPSAAGVMAYKIFHGPDFYFVKYSAEHLFDFIKGMQQLVAYFFKDDLPAPLKTVLQEAASVLSQPAFEALHPFSKSKEMPLGKQLTLAHFIRYRYKRNILQLLDTWYQLDAWYGMSMAVKKLGLVFPKFTHTPKPLLHLKGLYHLLLPQPVAYDIALDPEKNFLFLTGANMAGKSTFIKSVGTAVFLAHLGMGVPAAAMELSVFDGLLSNINVVDNIARGESYFYNEVQRIKSTVQKIAHGKNWLILIDELFKGTNVQDAMKCSIEVIEGFLKIKDSMFILSTHLYEIGAGLQQHPNILFRYFETSVKDEQLQFSFQLKDGISNDRLGYLILKREGVVDLLQQL